MHRGFVLLYQIVAAQQRAVGRQVARQPAVMTSSATRSDDVHCPHCSLPHTLATPCSTFAHFVRLSHQTKTMKSALGQRAANGASSSTFVGARPGELASQGYSACLFYMRLLHGSGDERSASISFSLFAAVSLARAMSCMPACGLMARRRREQCSRKGAFAPPLSSHATTPDPCTSIQYPANS